MKKLLLNYKSLNYAILLLLLCANSIYSQTVFKETFGTAAVAAPFTGGTSTVPASSITYTQNSNGAISTALLSGSTDAYLNLASSGASGRPNLTAPFSALPSGLNTTLTNNTNLVTWTVNMRVSRAMSSATQGYSDGQYYLAVVLCASTPNLIDGSTSGTDGYALILQRSVDNAASTPLNPGAVRLVKFHNGIGSSTAVSPALGSVVSTALLATPALNAGATATATAPNNVSIKVEYNADFDSWTMYYREDPIAGGFADPSSGSFTSLGSVTDATYTSTAMSHFGFLGSFSTSASASNQQQIDNFKIVLSPLPAFTPPPTTEKRQAFNSTPTPTVANLVATSTIGGTFKWYDALSGGNLLSSSTPLTYTNYYVSQTVNSIESTRVATQVFVGNTALKTLPLHENFANYNITDKLILMNNGASTALSTNSGTGLGSWTITPSSNITDDVTIVASPTWANTLIPTASGNAITYVGSGIDPELKFTNTTSGSLYSSFLFTAADATSIVSASAAAAAANPPTTVPAGVDPDKSTPTGIYSFYSENVVAGVATTEYSADVMFRKNFTNTKFNIGLSKSNSGDECVWSTTEYDFGAQYLIVISYENIGDAVSTNQVANLWIDPTTNTTPLPPPTLTQNNPTTSVSRNNIDRIKILQASSSSTPTLIIDEIRVANNWGQALGGAATLGITSVKTSGLKIYPNPVSNGKFYIDSITNLEKDVTIYNTLGQQVQKSKASNEGIDVSYLSKGTYFVKITEAGISATKKLVIQ